MEAPRCEPLHRHRPTGRLRQLREAAAAWLSATLCAMDGQFPAITDNPQAQLRTIAGWKPLAPRALKRSGPPKRVGAAREPDRNR